MVVLLINEKFVAHWQVNNLKQNNASTLEVASQSQEWSKVQVSVTVNYRST